MKLKFIINNQEKKKILANFFSLFLLQGINYLIPLITFPYLVRVVGVEKYGLLSFTVSIINYFSVVIDYGFNLTATKDVAINRENKEKLKEIFSSVMIIKSMMMFASFVFLFVMVVSVRKFRQDYLIYFLSFGMVVGQMLFPVWFFQGIEKMKYITYLNVLSKAVFAISIFLFVKHESDFYLVPTFTSAGFIISGIWALFLMKKKFGILFEWQSSKTIKYYLFDGWDIFVSRVFGAMYRNSNVVILGFLTNNMFVGYYSIAEKIIKILQSMQDVFGNALFPFLGRKNDDDKSAFLKLNNRYIKYIVFLYAVMTILLFSYSDFLSLLFFGDYNDNVILNVKIMSLVVFIGGMNYYYGILGLVSMGYKKEFSNYVVVIGVLNFALCYFFVAMYQDLGAVIAFVVSECLLLILIGKKFIN
ncbi:polysaccharide biosynthesis protein [Chloroherpeton thalassium ATCC 35110]|uniref:Polysaccharide biosynthesis protein n=1 Tax=Chloroherpeton thalassium (strain ATCC 35110 / GB-78) TaxID=517418 RepID=B3QV18_CHLT3|nr:flippase [Chloroherpeton thalassium]ACF14519.1 polysaccharide biosynthesis protein [Chloroherpeton thalassium ATCC 35110]